MQADEETGKGKRTAGGSLPGVKLFPACWGLNKLRELQFISHSWTYIGCIDNKYGCLCLQSAVSKKGAHNDDRSQLHIIVCAVWDFLWFAVRSQNSEKGLGALNAAKSGHLPLLKAKLQARLN